MKASATEELYLQFERTLTDVWEKLKNAGSRISYEEVLICFFECMIIRFCGQEGQVDPSCCYEEGRRYLHELAGPYIQTGLFARGKYECKDLEQMSASFFAAFDAMNRSLGLDVSHMGLLFEEFFNKEPEGEGTGLKRTAARKDAGMFFSDETLVRFIVKKLTAGKSREEIKNSSFLDPSMGGGIFIYILLEELGRRDRNFDLPAFVRNHVYGVDKNPLLVDIFRLCLWVKYAKTGLDIKDICAQFQAEDSLLLGMEKGEHTWQQLFPEAFKEGGFDFVMGNPPWGRIKANIREYNLFHSNLTDRYQGDRLKDKIGENREESKAWEAYKVYISSYSERLKASPDFRCQRYEIRGTVTGGDADLYRYFLELGYHVLKKGGMLGFIIPAAFYMSEGATGLRHLFLENGTIKALINFENKKHIFPIHPSFKFALLLYQKQGRPGNIEKAVFDLTDVRDIAEPERYRRLPFLSCSRSFLNKCSRDYWAVPECSGQGEMEILKKMYAAFPLLGEKRKGMWSVIFNRELDMTLDSGRFLLASETGGEAEREKGNVLPVYEGRMVHQYSSSRKIYISGSGRTALWKINPEAEQGRIVPHYYVRAEEGGKNLPGIYRAGYCDITGQKNVRTILASLIPPRAVCGNKVPTCTFLPDNRLPYHLYWLGIANSFVMDWLMRKKVTITLNFFHWNQVPFPRLEPDEGTGMEIASRAAVILEKINGMDLQEVLEREGSSQLVQKYRELKTQPVWKLRTEIDCLAAELYGLTGEELALILLGFPALDSGQKGVEGDLRRGGERRAAYVTRDFLLYYYMRDRFPEGNVDITELYRRAGAEIGPYTGKLRQLGDRIAFYKENGSLPYCE